MLTKHIGGWPVVEDKGRFLLVADPCCCICKGTGKGNGVAPAVSIWKITKHPTILAEGFEVERDCSEIKYCPCQKRVDKPDDWDLREMIDAAKEGEAGDAAGGD